jgi:CheY-like chemotaxis protein
MTDEQYTIMLVDDDRFLLDMYAKKFSDEGYRVEACRSVSEALAALGRGEEPAAIVFDILMPEETGYDLLTQLKEKKLAGNALKVALTNQGADEEKERIKKLGADEYIVKASMIPSEVFNTVNSLITKQPKA